MAEIRTENCTLTVDEYKVPEQKYTRLKDLVNPATPEDFIIPPYQRPYKWDKKNVTQLLDDIYEYIEVKKKIYRIGNIIIHKNSKKNIVDGQQRLTTISLLLKQLDPEFNKLLINQEFKLKISERNIINNYKTIGNWLDQKFGEKYKDESKEKKLEFKEKILGKCEFVVFTVYDEDEAFQLFDSQNTRGKELEPYDLLKAFHLREMDPDKDEKDIKKYVKLWDEFIYNNNELKDILENYLFRIRKWSKNERTYYFTRADVDEFKGISLHESKIYPYAKTFKILNDLCNILEADALKFPFSITMPIINGKRFFEYIEHYIQRKKILFEETSFLKFYNIYCLDYKGAGRPGDEKIRNLYENILLLFIDRFDFTEDFYRFYKAFYKATYITRCKNNSIKVGAILNEILENDSGRNIFLEINYANNPDYFNNYLNRKYKIVKKADEMVKYIEFIKDFINGKKDESI